LVGSTENYFGSYATPESFFERALTVEHLQHGISSGVDIAVCQTELPCVYYNQHLEAATVPELPHAWLVNTGKPEVSTGVCVQAVKTHFQNSGLIHRFEEVTLGLIQALMEMEDEKSLSPLIAENHRLLCQIGVVPEKIRRFIQQIESLGGAGKLCGAGSTQGENGGVAWVMGASERILPILSQFGYSYEPLRCAHHISSAID
jgi:mevalonate kinase